MKVVKGRLKRRPNSSLWALVTAVWLCAGATTLAGQTDFDRWAPRADSLLRLMTLEEKLGQLQQLDGGISAGDMPALIRAGKVGSVINEVDPAKLAAYQTIALKESRLGIPLLIGRDVIHGFRTIFPIPLGLASSWDASLVTATARAAAAEARAAGIHWTFAPMLDISRDPRWGRIAESAGEDPLLTSVLGAAYIRGFQGENLSGGSSIAACAKHFAGYGAAEGGRDYNTVNMDERQLREVYLRPFQAARQAGVATFMTAFNELNDVPASAHTFLLRKVLKGEWNFKGFVVSDWNAILEMIPHGYSTDAADAAQKAMNAGVDMEMVSQAYSGEMAGLLKDDRVTARDIDDAVRRILCVKFALGLFENPFPTKLDGITDANRALAQKAAAESAVLLKNDGNLLPLDLKKQKIALIGPLAHAPYEQLGTWIFDGRREDAVTPRMALEAQGAKLFFAEGLAYSRDTATTRFAKAVEMAKNADVVVFVAGEESILSGEAHSRADITLPGAQLDLLRAVAQTGKPVVLVVMAGRPLVLTQTLPYADAILYAWHPGTMAGPALAEVLGGKVSPSGKLPVSFPIANGQSPLYYNHKRTGRPPTEYSWTPMADIPQFAPQTSLGNTSHYLDAGYKPLFPFGFGLSYTSFTYTDMAVTALNDTIRVVATVQNTGKRTGAEVVQLYVADRAGSVTRPVKELKTFEKIMLKPGESRTLVFHLTTADLSFYRADMSFGPEPGFFDVWVGGDSATGLHGEFEWPTVKR